MSCCSDKYMRGFKVACDLQRLSRDAFETCWFPLIRASRRGVTGSCGAGVSCLGLMVALMGQPAPWEGGIPEQPSSPPSSPVEDSPLLPP